MESTHHREPWNKGKLVGQKPPLKPKDIWAIRIQLQNAHQVRDLAMFNLAIDSKLRGCDLVNLHVRDITHGQSGFGACHGRAAENAKAGAVRTDGADQIGRCPAWIEKAKPEARAMPVSQAASPNHPCVDAAVRSDRASVGCRHRTRSDGLWHAHNAADQGHADLQDGRRTCGRFNYCLDTANWRAPSDTLESR
jgi:hypothetical protein